MKHVALLCAAVAGLMVPAAGASTFDISFNGGPLGYSGSGVFTARTTTGALYTVNGVVSGSVTDPNFGTSSILGLSTFAGADELLSFPSPTFFDDSGLSFTLANGVSINLFFDGFNEAALQSNVAGDIPELVTDSVKAVTPEPSSLVLLGTAAMLGVADLRRRRHPVA